MTTYLEQFQESCQKELEEFLTTIGRDWIISPNGTLTDSQKALAKAAFYRGVRIGLERERKFKEI